MSPRTEAIGIALILVLLAALALLLSRQHFANSQTCTARCETTSAGAGGPAIAPTFMAVRPRSSLGDPKSTRGVGSPAGGEIPSGRPTSSAGFALVIPPCRWGNVQSARGRLEGDCIATDKEVSHAAELAKARARPRAQRRDGLIEQERTAIAHERDEQNDNTRKEVADATDLAIAGPCTNRAHGSLSIERNSTEGTAMNATPNFTTGHHRFSRRGRERWAAWGARIGEQAVAQLEEQRCETPRVVGSIPTCLAECSARDVVSREIRDRVRLAS